MINNIYTGLKDFFSQYIPFESLINLIVFFILILTVFIFHKIILRSIKKALKRLKIVKDEFLIKLIRRTIIPVLYFGAVFVYIKSFSFEKKYDLILNIFAGVLLSFFVLRFISSLIRYFLEKQWEKNEEDQSKINKIKGLFPAMNIIIWGIGLLFILDNLGVNISTIVAGLGIGGIAVALAAQALLGDMFSYFSMMFDRPFELGDFIIIDNYMGTVEHIGIKTTRIRSLSGEQLVFSNTDLTNSRVKNYKRMGERRVVFKIGVTYNTPLEKLQKIPQVIKKIIEKINNTRFDRVHFSSYGDFSLNYEIVYYVLSGDYNIYMDINQEINFKIYEAFDKEKIEFAFPTQTLFLNK
jgi:small-conductance mechanosensitive channel